MINKDITVLSFPDYEEPARRIAQELDAIHHCVHLHHFPDGESLVRLPTQLSQHVVICRSLHQPNEKLIEIFLCAETARRLGAKTLTLIAPYLCYMRQDIENQPGEAISQKIIGKWLADNFENVITVDPHLHRIQFLHQAIPNRNAITISAATTIGEYLKQAFNDAVLIGPDSESEQWVSIAAKGAGFEYAVGRKIRFSDKNVAVSFDEINIHNKVAIIVDDVLSTGHTVAKAAEQLYQNGASAVHVAITHALFSENAQTVLANAKIQQVISTDSIPHATNRILLAQPMAHAVRTLLTNSNQG